MRYLIAAIACIWPTAAMADPVSIAGAVTAVSSWWASIGVVGQALVGIGIALAATGISYLLNAGRSQQQAQNDNLPSVNIPERDGLLERVRLYGTSTTPGGVFFQKVSDADPSVYVYGVAISEGVCDGLEALIINGVECLLDDAGYPLTAPWRDGATTYLKASFRGGEADQSIDPIISARFPSKSSSFRQRGVCTAVVEMNFGADADQHSELWGAGGIPQLLFRVRGLRIYDPRDAMMDAADATTWAWSDNATLVQADWMTCSMGFGIAPTLMDWPSIRDSATVDDATMDTLAGSERVGRCNGRAFSSESNADVLDAMTQQNRALVRQADGVYSIRSQMAAQLPVATMYQDQLVGDLAYQNEPDTRAAINSVTVEFAAAELFNQSGEVTYSDAALIAADGETYEQRVAMRYCDSPAMAQRLGYMMLEENRNGRTLRMGMDVSVLLAPGKTNRQIEIGDVVRVDMRNYTTINGLYVVNSIEIATDFIVQVDLSGYDPAIITGWSVDMEQPFGG